MPSDESSFQNLVHEIRRGNDDAVARLWGDFFPRVLGLAAKRLEGQRARHAGEEDVALSVIESVVTAIRKGRIQKLDTRDDLWRLLAAMTRRKVVDLVRYNGVRDQVGESALNFPGDTESIHVGLARLAQGDLPPDVAVSIEAECQRLLDLLPKQAYRDVAMMRVSGFTVREIAEKQGCHVTTIERHLQIIRKYWQKESEPAQSDRPHE